ncbi:MAG: CRISPR-associated protein Cas4 [Chitinophagales bacterium]|jgi:CRISPR-associated exonuclease Cas4|nr:CRISPR-associated protein Cas4 [Chitinophagales bacterium]
MNITATHINYYHICKRKLWLFSHHITMEHTSDTVYEGKLIGEHSYPYRSEKYTELELDGIKIDYFDAKNGIIHETKKSDSVEQAHIAQVKYYLYVLQKNGISAHKGIIEYPKLRKTEQVILTEEDTQSIENQLVEIQQILENETCPPKIQKSFCKSCSYFEFCWGD